VNECKYATITLGRDGMGPEADEADFEAWVAYVSARFEHIEQGAGLDGLSIETRERRDVQSTAIAADDAHAIESILSDLWDDFCADTEAWPKRDVLEAAGATS
jgi:hypothetical protein